MGPAFQAWVQRWNIPPGPSDRPGATHYEGRDGYVGDGWVPLLDGLAKELVALGWNRRLAQVKEKWAGLRFYPSDPPTPDMQTRIDRAEAQSLVVCERCGASRPHDVTKSWCEPCTRFFR